MERVERVKIERSRRWMIQAAGAIPGVLATVGGASGQAVLKKTRLDILTSTSLFGSVNPNDIRSALRVWVSMIGRRRGYEFDPKVELISGVEEVRRLLGRETFGLVALDAFEYFQLGDLFSLQPRYWGSLDQRGDSGRFLLLVRGDSGVTAMEALRGKRVHVCESSRARMGLAWLDTILVENGAVPAARFFGPTEIVDKASAALLPVFFGKSDAAVVSEAHFHTAREMNPQLGSRLKTLSVSPPYFEQVLCFNPRGLEYPDVVDESVRDLHTEPEGTQLLMVMRYKRFAPMTKPLMDRTRELWRRHKTLQAKEGKGI
jgi:hypothetical protein